MAHNLLGVSLHANQDFYSHSNWIDDDDLRSRTWFEVDPDSARLPEPVERHLRAAAPLRDQAPWRLPLRVHGHQQPRPDRAGAR